MFLSLVLNAEFVEDCVESHGRVVQHAARESKTFGGLVDSALTLNRLLRCGTCVAC
jgi:light-regulated signal transduction histidine kinase (bacteriophytochrome)